MLIVVYPQINVLFRLHYLWESVLQMIKNYLIGRIAVLSPMEAKQLVKYVKVMECGAKVMTWIVLVMKELYIHAYFQPLLQILRVEAERLRREVAGILMNNANPDPGRRQRIAGREVVLPMNPPDAKMTAADGNVLAILRFADK